MVFCKEGNGVNEYGKEKNKQLLRQTLKFIIEETAELQNAVTAQVAGKATEECGFL